MSGNSAPEQAILERVVNKIPGNPVQSKKEKQGFVDLSLKTKSDLLELIERQSKLLSKKQFINNLPDKGEKILKYKNQLEDELRNREKSDELSDMLLQLNLNGKPAMDKLEWTGNYNPGQVKYSDVAGSVGVNEDDNADPLKILATHSGTVFNKRITRVLAPEVSLIKPSDIEDANEDQKKTSENKMEVLNITDTPSDETDFEKEEYYIKTLCDKFDKVSGNTNSKDKFLPHRTLRHNEDKTSNVTTEQKVKNPYWENTAATPPPSVYNNVKFIPLEVSVKLQIQQAEKLKEVQVKHAMEKLKVSGRGSGDVSWPLTDKGSHFRNPRTHYESGSSSSNEEDEHENYQSCNEDEDADEKRGGITFYNLIDN